jgi:hypothetical protein
MWRFGLMLSISFLVLGAVMAVLGRIDYQYHYGSTQVVGVIRREDTPFRFWLIIGTFIVMGTACTAITGMRHSKIRREENTEPIQSTETTRGK